jgi:hypothetical protein
MKRTLSLKRETLSALTNDDLAGIAGGATVPGCVTPAVNSLDPITGCVATVQQSRLVCSGSVCNTYNSDCSCRI